MTIMGGAVAVAGVVLLIWPGTCGRYLVDHCSCGSAVRSVDLPGAAPQATQEARRWALLNRASLFPRALVADYIAKDSPLQFLITSNRIICRNPFVRQRDAHRLRGHRLRVGSPGSMSRRIYGDDPWT
jgi:hypothetical protein